MDVLSEVLRGVQLKGSLFGQLEVRAPRGVAFPRTEAAMFHLVVEGEVWLRQPGRGREVAVAAGEVLLLPHGGAHVLSGSRQGEPVPLGALIAKLKKTESPPVLRAGGTGARAVLVCGYYRFDQRELPQLLQTLPGLIDLRRQRREASPWLSTAVAAIATEAAASRPGRAAVLDYLTGLLFIEGVRAHLSDLGDHEASWLRALSDPGIGRALNRLHADPARAWTVSSLAREARMSRSAFAQKFLELAGDTPMRYAAMHRMRRAAFYLRTHSVSVTEAMERVGYRSEATFSKAFKRWMGQPPAKYRREAQGLQMTPEPLPVN